MADEDVWAIDGLLDTEHIYRMPPKVESKRSAALVWRHANEKAMSVYTPTVSLGKISSW